MSECWRLCFLVFVLLVATEISSHVWNRTDSSFYEVIIPQLLEHDQSHGYKSQISYMVDIGGEKYIVHLRKKRIFLSANFPVYTYSRSAMLHMEEPYIRDDCYYHGYVEGFTDSVVGISTCYGLRGFLQFRNLSYGIEPLELSNNFQHIVYRTEHMYPENMYSESISCGMNYVNQKMYSKGTSHDLKLKEIHVSSQNQYVESFVIVSKGQFDYLRKNETAVIEEIISVINQADAMYESLNVHLMLVGIEIWTTDDLISTTSHSAESILNDFAHWKVASLDPRLTYDNAALILRETVPPTIGLAFDSKICQPEKSAFYAVFQGNRTTWSAVIFAHELGHCLGMRHEDPSNCNCGNNNCIMAPNAISSFAFSDCSIIDMADFKASGDTRCLLNIPGTGKISGKTCGNAIVEGEEECDCGTQEECKRNLCCIFGTCKLSRDALCAHGKCCVNCKLAKEGITCRQAVNECDLPDYCDGINAECGDNTFKQKGTPCNQHQGYCYEGVCQYHDAQCQAIFGAGTSSGEFICYEEANMQGDRFGNCGFKEKAFVKCALENVMCGKIQCVHPISAPTFVKNGTIIYYSPKGTLCKTIDFSHTVMESDKAWVNTGTKCGTNKICLNHKCLEISQLNVTCDPKTQCNGRGVCDDSGECHCNLGWDPPNCERKAVRGSTDTVNMAKIADDSLKKWLLVGTGLLVVILVVIISIIIIRRRRTENCESESSHTYESEEDRQSQNTGTTGKTSTMSSNPSA